MIGRRIVPAVVIHVLLAGPLMILMPAGSARAANLPTNVRQAIATGPVMQQIEAYVRERLTAMAGEDVAAQSKARDDLISEVMSVPVAPTQQFLDAYARVLNNSMETATKSQDPRVRLNAAIVTARVAENSNAASLRLLPTTLALLGDSSDATLLWAAKAAKAILPSALQGGGGGGNGAAANAPATPLIAALVKIGKTSRAGTVVQSVYDALCLDSAKLTGAAWDAGLTATIPGIHQIMAARVQQYNQGIPDEPMAEQVPAIHLTSSQVWPAAAAKMFQVATMQQLSDVIGVAAQRMDGATTEQRQDLMTLVRNFGKAIQAAGGFAQNPVLVEAGKRFSPTITTTPAEAVAMSREGFAALKAIPAFAALTPPPALSANPTPATTTTTAK